MKRLTMLFSIVAVTLLSSFTTSANGPFMNGPSPFGPCIAQPSGIGGPSTVDQTQVSSANFFTDNICDVVSYHWFYSDSQGELWAETTSFPFSSVPIPGILRAGQECGTFTIKMRAYVDDGYNAPFFTSWVTKTVTVTGCGS